MGRDALVGEWCLGFYGEWENTDNYYSQRRQQILVSSLQAFEEATEGHSGMAHDTAGDAEP